MIESKNLYQERTLSPNKKQENMQKKEREKGNFQGQYYDYLLMKKKKIEKYIRIIIAKMLK